MNAYIELMNSLAESHPQPEIERARRKQVWSRILEVVEQGISTGSKMLDRMVLQGRDAVDISENIYHVPYVPTPEEHFLRQDPGEAGVIFRPHLMLHISSHFKSWKTLLNLDVTLSLAEQSFRDHPLNTSQEYCNVSTRCPLPHCDGTEFGQPGTYATVR